MRRALSLVCLLAFWTLAAAAAPVEIEVARMSPTTGFVLPRFGTIYLEIAYRSDQPLRLQARAYAKGKSLDAGQMMNASAVQLAALPSPTRTSGRDQGRWKQRTFQIRSSNTAFNGVAGGR